jgi:hypothetical protein
LNVKGREEEGVRGMMLQHTSDRDGKGMLEEEGNSVTVIK